MGNKWVVCILLECILVTSNSLIFCTCQLNMASFHSIALCGSAWCERCWTKFPMYITMLQKYLNCCLSIWHPSNSCSLHLDAWYHDYTLHCRMRLCYLSSSFFLFSTGPSLSKLARLVLWSLHFMPKITVIMNTYYPYALYHDVYLHLKYILAHFHSK